MQHNDTSGLAADSHDVRRPPLRPAIPAALIGRIARALTASVAAMTSVRAPASPPAGLASHSGGAAAIDEEDDDCVGVGCCQTLGNGPRRPRRA